MKINKERLYEIIFEADTREGKTFDICLIIVILISILFVILDSIGTIHEKYYLQLRVAEWFITITFTIEYLLRIYHLKKPLKNVTLICSCQMAILRFCINEPHRVRIHH
jgi:voltage-gated potassium channel